MNDIVRIINFCKKHGVSFSYNYKEDVLVFYFPFSKDDLIFDTKSEKLLPKYLYEPERILFNRHYFDDKNKIGIKDYLRNNLKNH